MRNNSLILKGMQYFLNSGLSCHWSKHYHIACISDWKKSVVEPEMEFDDVSTDIALSQGELQLFSWWLLRAMYVKGTVIRVNMCICAALSIMLRRYCHSTNVV